MALLVPAWLKFSLSLIEIAVLYRFADGVMIVNMCLYYTWGNNLIRKCLCLFVNKPKRDKEKNGYQTYVPLDIPMFSHFFIYIQPSLKT